jgi:hypothetical protein
MQIVDDIFTTACCATNALIEAMFINKSGRFIGCSTSDIKFIFAYILEAEPQRPENKHAFNGIIL